MCEKYYFRFDTGLMWTDQFGKERSFHQDLTLACYTAHCYPVMDFSYKGLTVFGAEPQTSFAEMILKMGLPTGYEEYRVDPRS